MTMSIKYPTLNFIPTRYPFSFICLHPWCFIAQQEIAKWENNSKKIEIFPDNWIFLLDSISARNSEGNLWSENWIEKIAIEVSKNILFHPSRIRLLTRRVLRCNVCVTVSQFGQFDLPSHTLVIIIIIIRHRQRWIHVQ